jgi:hypothetical protein
MCDACEDWDAREPREPAMDPRLAPRARGIERAMPGETLPDATWRIALGEDSGAIAWADYQRILAAFQAAEAAARRPSRFAGRRRRARLGCDGAG